MFIVTFKDVATAVDAYQLISRKTVSDDLVTCMVRFRKPRKGESSVASDSAAQTEEDSPPSLGT
jgi:hypothetical protein